MRMINCNDFSQGADTLKLLYINLCDMYLEQLNQNKSLALNQFLTKYNINETRQAFRNIILDNNNFLCFPDDNIILRYLEYGGEDIRPTHLLSLAKNKLYQSLSNERRLN